MLMEKLNVQEFQDVVGLGLLTNVLNTPIPMLPANIFVVQGV